MTPPSRPRRTVTAVTAAIAALALASITLPPPATADVAAVADVRISWVDASRSAVRISWTETTPVPNHVETRYGNSYPGLPERYLSVVQPNSVQIPAADFGTDQIVRIAVSAGSPSTPDTGTAFSAWFDTATLPAPRVNGIAPTAGGTVTWTWTAVTAKPDQATPNDPLDLATTPVRYQPLRSYGGGMTAAGPATTAARATQRDPGGAYRLGVAALNEWRPAPDPYAAIYTAADMFDASATILTPRLADYGATVTVSGRLRLLAYGCTPAGACGRIDHGPAAGRAIRVEARKNSTSPWQTVRSTTTDSSGNYRVTATIPGSRQHRTVVLPRDTGADYHRGTTSAMATTVSGPRLYSARFLDPTVGYGRPAHAFVAVAPPGTARVLLQRRGGDGAFRGIAYVAMRSGRAIFALTATPRGTTYYRYVIPPTTYAGHYLTGRTTPAFPLLVH